MFNERSPAQSLFKGYPGEKFTKEQVPARYSKSRSQMIMRYLQDDKKGLTKAFREDIRVFYDKAVLIIRTADPSIMDSEVGYFTRKALEVIGVY